MMSPPGLHLGMAYHWRLRTLYNPATTPFMPASRWVTIPWNGWNETDLRTMGSQIQPAGGDARLLAVDDSVNQPTYRPAGNA